MYSKPELPQLTMESMAKTLVAMWMRKTQHGIVEISTTINGQSVLSLRIGIKKINYPGDLKGNLCMHCWVSSTACPGPYLKTKFRYIADEVNKILIGKDAPFLVKVSITDLNIRKGAGTNYKSKGYIKPGVYTIVETKDNWGKLKSGAGWICLDYAVKV